jgi:hypothetical protein
MRVVAIALLFVTVAGSSVGIGSRCLGRLLFASNNTPGLRSTKNICNSSPPCVIIHRCKLWSFAIFATIDVGGIGKGVHCGRGSSVGVTIARSGGNSSVGIVVAGKNSSKTVYVL